MPSSSNSYLHGAMGELPVRQILDTTRQHQARLHWGSNCLYVLEKMTVKLLEGGL